MQLNFFLAQQSFKLGETEKLDFACCNIVPTCLYLRYPGLVISLDTRASEEYILVHNGVNQPTIKNSQEACIICFFNF
ncbi:hypothetical protein FJR38_20025 [Anabaena sp. UHCC 0253]|uniref:hypothetical protein n=1 Tax=Anabaena sp. UHCC 0253 TaxID=2590019 RepID=UPI0014489DB4|nr:hypothetical protein [Anabaena sp. UHCC 0253]MTJ54788.1 hypothetical protein [Anabaena sp. UHCC 0253]